MFYVLCSLESDNKNHKGNSVLHHLYIDVMDIEKVSISDLYIESNDGTASTKENIFSLRDLYNIQQVTITSRDLFKVFFLKENSCYLFLQLNVNLFYLIRL